MAVAVVAVIVAGGVFLVAVEDAAAFEAVAVVAVAVAAAAAVVVVAVVFEDSEHGVAVELSGSG
mgnify:CR=1 FL=1